MFAIVATLDEFLCESVVTNVTSLRLADNGCSRRGTESHNLAEHNDDWTTLCAVGTRGLCKPLRPRHSQSQAPCQKCGLFIEANSFLDDSLFLVVFFFNALRLKARRPSSGSFRMTVRMILTLHGAARHTRVQKCTLAALAGAPFLSTDGQPSHPRSYSPSHIKGSADVRYRKGSGTWSCFGFLPPPLFSL